MRLRPNRCVFGAPPPYQGTGRPHKHGEKMKLSDPTTWAIPVESIKINDPTWGQIEIRAMESVSFLSFRRSSDGNYTGSIALEKDSPKRRLSRCG